jgi:diguanylate cyclase (GGDEF)-like protein/PAS domain S-box-containing protein
MKQQTGDLIDPAEHKSTEPSLRESEEIFRTIAENVDDLIALLDTEGRRIYNSPSYHKIFGKEELAVGSSSFNEIHPEDRDRIKAIFRKTVKTGIGERSEFRFLLRDGKIRYIESQGNAVHDINGKVSKVIVVSRDVTERKKMEEKFRHLSYHDPLTGLPNRVLFSDRLKLAIAAARRDKGRLLSLMFMDLDDFKQVNDTYGHATGDLLLKEVASRIQESLRESDTAARMGGDEFVVLLPTIETQLDARVVAEKIRHAICQPINLGGHRLNVSPSIGIVVYPENGSEEEALLKNADAAMYHAKESGRNNVCFFSAVKQGNTK